MGLIFDRRAANAYEVWYRSPQGRAMDRAMERLLLFLLTPRKGERVLDIGCGTGNHLLMLNRLGLDVSGVDASQHMIDQAKKRLGNCCTLEFGMAEDLPFDDNEFDLAVLIGTLEFMDNPNQALREAGRVANRKVFVGLLNSFSLSGMKRKIQGLFGDPLFQHARFLNLWRLQSLLRQSYGPVPISWGGVSVGPAFIDDIRLFGKDLQGPRHSPFASFLALSATMVPGMKAKALPLEIGMKKPSHSFFGAKTLEDMKHHKGVDGDERGLPV